MSGWVKICGVTNTDDATLVVEAGADALGINLWPQSPRSVALDRAVSIAEGLRCRIEIVAVTVDATAGEMEEILERLEPDRVQLHGDENDERVRELLPRGYKAMGVAEDGDVERALKVPGEWLLVDARDPVRRGGTGEAPPWSLAAQICAARLTVLAGGLDPDNVAAAIAACRPAGVDAASRLESAPGVKDPARVRGFVEAARRAFESM